MAFYGITAHRWLAVCPWSMAIVTPRKLAWWPWSWWICFWPSSLRENYNCGLEWTQVGVDCHYDSWRAVLSLTHRFLSSKLWLNERSTVSVHVWHRFVFVHFECCAQLTRLRCTWNVQLHCLTAGPVVSGVVGTRSPRYCLWGIDVWFCTQRAYVTSRRFCGNILDLVTLWTRHREWNQMDSPRKSSCQRPPQSTFSTTRPSAPHPVAWSQSRYMDFA